jgi:hypothetical protein
MIMRLKSSVASCPTEARRDEHKAHDIASFLATFGLVRTRREK